MGFLPGKRESRRMMGPYVLTERDITMETPFDDTVAYGGWPMDNHHPDGFYHVGKPTTYGDTPSPYRIPYRCLYSVNIENLWFAGRNISTSHLAMSSTRVMATCALLGEAVGTAANIAREFNLTPNGVYLEKIKLLQQRLMENGCFLPYLKREIADVCKAATLSCEGVEHLENLRNGMDRNHFTYGEGDRRVTLAAGKAVTYTFEQPTVLENVHLNFDSDLDRDTLPGDQCERRHSMRANRNFDSPTMCMPKTLVKGYSLSAVTAEGETLLIAETDCNLLGCVNFELPDRPLKSVSFIPHETWGSEDMKIFSFDVR